MWKKVEEDYCLPLLLEFLELPELRLLLPDDWRLPELLLERCTLDEPDDRLDDR
jgi:hypothetical protein